MTKKTKGKVIAVAVAAIATSMLFACKKDKVAVEGITVTPTEKQIAVGESFAIVAEVVPSNALNKEIKWNSTNESVATIDANGTVTGINTGETTIIATSVDGGKTAKCLVVVIANLNGIKYVTIPNGSFTMGSPENESGRVEDEIQHEVTITKSFKMSKNEITNQQFANFLNEKNIDESGKYPSGKYPEFTLIKQCDADSYWGLIYKDSKWTPVEGKESNPVVFVTWFGADEFARHVGGRLPTEAEWEYACRAESTTIYSFGTNVSQLAEYAWYGRDLEAQSSPVGAKKPNAWGLYDMHGNVWEWCSDWWSDYTTEPQTDPSGPEDGATKIMRGGCWWASAKSVRSAYRNYPLPGTAASYIGFRVVTEAD